MIQLFSEGYEFCEWEYTVVPHREITALALFFDVRVHSVVWRQWDALYGRCKRKKG
jgi:hypothetical protein